MVFDAALLGHSSPYSEEQRRVLGLYGEAMQLAVEQPPLLGTQSVHAIYKTMGTYLADAIRGTDGYVPIVQIPEGGRRVTQRAISYATEIMRRGGDADEIGRLVVFDMPVHRYDGARAGEPRLPDGFELTAKALRAIEGKCPLSFEDIWDRGVTLNFVTEELANRGASGVDVSLLVDKPGAPGAAESHPGLRKVQVGLSYSGDNWLIGGECLDWKGGFGRSLTDLYECRGAVVKPLELLPGGTADAMDAKDARDRRRFWEIWDELRGMAMADGRTALDFLDTIHAISLGQIAEYASR